jgi:hypothetical protein
MTDRAELDHYGRLRGWARGAPAVEAATELLIRGGWAQETRPWVHGLDGGAGCWVDFQAIPDQIGGMSGGERRYLRIAVSLGAGAPVDLDDALSTLDRRSAALVLAAVAHAAGIYTATGEALHPGPATDPATPQPVHRDMGMYR